MDRYLKERIEEITDEDLFGQIRASSPCGSARKLFEEGHRDEAYERLGQLHAESLSTEADALRTHVASALADDDAAKRTREQADEVIARNIRGWHSHRQQFGPVIDFNADYGPSGQYGFHYLGWLRPELDLYVHTGEENYADDFLDIVQQYFDQRLSVVRRIAIHHPIYYELGAHMKTHIFLPAYAFFCQEDRMSVPQREAFLKMLMGFGRSLYRIAKGGYKSGNWQIVGGASLYWLGCAFPEWKEAAKWRKLGETRLREHALRDFFSDGGHSERCWGYGHMSLTGMASFYKAGVRHEQFSKKEQVWWKRFFRRAFRWFAHAAAPGNHTLNYGDGGINPITATINLAHELFPEWKKEKLLFGVDQTASRILPASGYAFMRDGSDTPEQTFLSINFGKWGGGHTHADLLDFTLWHDGEPVIEEVGRYGSYDNALNPLFRSPEAHNQIVIDHNPMNRSEHEATEVRWHSDDALDIFSGCHHAWPAACVRRQIVFVKQAGFAFIYDVVAALGYTFQVSSYLHAQHPFKLTDDGVAQVSGKPSCLVRFADPDNLRRLEPGLDFIRPAEQHTNSLGELYKFSDERHRLRAMKWNDVGALKPITFGMLLVPHTKKRAPATKLDMLTVKGDENEQAAAFEVEANGTKATLLFNPTNSEVHLGRKRTSATVAVKIGKAWTELA